MMNKNFGTKQVWDIGFAIYQQILKLTKRHVFQSVRRINVSILALKQALTTWSRITQAKAFDSGLHLNSNEIKHRFSKINANNRLFFSFFSVFFLAVDLY